MSLNKIIGLIIILCAVAGAWFLITEIYTAEAQQAETAQFEVKPGENAADLARRLADEQVIRNEWLFKKYLTWKGIDQKINVGKFEVKKPITLARVAEALSQLGLTERTITIIPGWDLRDVAEYLKKEGIAEPDELYKIAGEPANKNTTAAQLEVAAALAVLLDKPNGLSYEGYLAPDTYRVYNDATVKDILKKLVEERDRQFTEKMYQDIEAADRTVHEVLTIASILEREVRDVEDRAKVADIFWRRYDLNWALQADSTVHYALGKKGEVFTTAEERDSLNPWNTYRYPGLPPGPIANPSLGSIMAAIYPEKNDYWYFLTDRDGKVRYAKDLAGHNENREKWL